MTSLDQLFGQIDPAVHWIGHLKAITDNPDVEAKWNGSESGFALLTANLPIIECLFHFNYRCWFESKGAVTIGGACNLLHLSANSEISQRAAKILQSASLAAIKLVRVERYTHLAAGSSAFRRGPPDGRLEPALTVNELIEISTDTVLIAEALQVASGQSARNVRFQLDRSEMQCREFWRILPLLTDAEDL